jgi:hypothetical protein
MRTAPAPGAVPRVMTMALARGSSSAWDLASAWESSSARGSRSEPAAATSPERIAAAPVGRILRRPPAEKCCRSCRRRSPRPGCWFRSGCCRRCGLRPGSRLDSPAQCRGRPRRLRLRIAQQAHSIRRPGWCRASPPNDPRPRCAHPPAGAPTDRRRRRGATRDWPMLRDPWRAARRTPRVPRRHGDHLLPPPLLGEASPSRRAAPRARMPRASRGGARAAPGDATARSAA